MSKRRMLLIISLLIVVVVIVLPPILAPIIHDNTSPRSALREAIYKAGHPYQSFFAFITKGDYEDKEYGQRYNVYWFDYDSPTGDTTTICYTKMIENENYAVSCGTGP